MWQIQMDHPVQRPITFQMRDGMNDFLRSAHAADADMPTDVRKLTDLVRPYMGHPTWRDPPEYPLLVVT